MAECSKYGKRIVFLPVTNVFNAPLRACIGLTDATLLGRVFANTSHANACLIDI
jgi:hypothetical protein